MLQAGNPLFQHWSEAQRERYAVAGRDGGQELPVIPLVGRLHPRHGDAEPVPDWPLGKAVPAAFGPAIDARLDALFKALVRPWYLRWVLCPLWWLARRPLRQRLVAAMAGGLRSHGLG